MKYNSIETALEVQKQECLFVCLFVFKSEFYLSAFKCQPLTYLNLCKTIYIPKNVY